MKVFSIVLISICLAILAFGWGMAMGMLLGFWGLPLSLIGGFAIGRYGFQWFIGPIMFPEIYR